MKKLHTESEFGPANPSAALRKRKCFKCGGRCGWCTYDTLFRFVHWCGGALARGTYLSQRHAGLCWRNEDGQRQALAENEAPLKGVLFFHPAPRRGSPPCVLSVLSTRTTSTTATTPARQPLRVDGNTEAEVAQGLHYESRKDGGHGQTMQRDLPTGSGANEALPNIGRFEDLPVAPSRVVVFWRAAVESIASIRNLLFNIDQQNFDRVRLAQSSHWWRHGFLQSGVVGCAARPCVGEPCYDANEASRLLRGCDPL